MNSSPRDPSLQWLLDRAKIQDVLYRYATSVDMCDWLLLRSVFAYEIERDYSSFTGNPSKRIMPEQHIDECQTSLPGFSSTQHFLVNTDISIEGDHAKAVVYMTADHTLILDVNQQQFTIRGIYVFRLIRIAADWKICALKLNVLSTQGDQSLFELATARTANMDASQISVPRYRY